MDVCRFRTEAGGVPGLLTNRLHSAHAPYISHRPIYFVRPSLSRLPTQFYLALRFSTLAWKELQQEPWCLAAVLSRLPSAPRIEQQERGHTSQWTSERRNDASNDIFETAYPKRSRPFPAVPEKRGRSGRTGNPFNKKTVRRV